MSRRAPRRSGQVDGPRGGLPGGRRQVGREEDGLEGRTSTGPAEEHCVEREESHDHPRSPAHSVTTSAVTMPNMPSRPSTWGRMWQWKAHTPGRSASMMAS